MPINNQILKIINQLKHRQLIQTHLTQNLNQALIKTVIEITEKKLNNHEFNNSPILSKRLNIIQAHADNLIHNNIEYLSQWQRILKHPQQWEFKNIDPLIYHREFNQQLINQLVSTYEIKILQNPNPQWLLNPKLNMVSLTKYTYASQLLTKEFIQILN